jgi:hypothetical protein
LIRQFPLLITKSNIFPQEKELLVITLRMSKPVPGMSFDPDAYMALLFSRQADLPATYIAKQIEWAEQILQDRLAQAKNTACGEAGRVSARAAAGGVLAVAVAVEFSSGCVVAPQISLTHETTPILPQV